MDELAREWAGDISEGERFWGLEQGKRMASPPAVNCSQPQEERKRIVIADIVNVLLQECKRSHSFVEADGFILTGCAFRALMTYCRRHEQQEVVWEDCNALLGQDPVRVPGITGDQLRQALERCVLVKLVELGDLLCTSELKDQLLKMFPDPRKSDGAREGTPIPPKY